MIAKFLGGPLDGRTLDLRDSPPCVELKVGTARGDVYYVPFDREPEQLAFSEGRGGAALWVVQNRTVIRP